MSPSPSFRHIVAKHQLFSALSMGGVESVREVLREAVPLGLDRPLKERKKRVQDQPVVGAIIEIGARLWRGLARTQALRRSPGLLRERSNTPLMIAAFYGQPELVKLLLPFSDPLTRNNLKETSLMRAADACNAECLKLLLPVSDPLAVGRDGRTSLMRVIERREYPGLEECVKLLLPASNVAARSAIGQTALMRAVINREAEVIKLLLPYSDLDAKDHDGKTAWDLALHAHANEVLPHLSTGNDVQRYWECLDVMSQTVPLKKAKKALDASRLRQSVPDGALMGLRARVEREELAQVLHGGSAFAALAAARSRGVSAQHKGAQGVNQDEGSRLAGPAATAPNTDSIETKVRPKRALSRRL